MVPLTMVNYEIIIQIVFAAIISFILVFISIPTILTVAKYKNLFDEPGTRHVHKHRVPTLGGLAIFLGIIFTYSLFRDWFEYTSIPFLIPALLIIFAIGFKDDILITAPIIKLLGQLLAAFIIVGFGDIRITNFHGFFGLTPDYFTSLFFTVLFIVFIVNGFNLIDGVDGLAGITGIITVSSFSVWFFINNIAFLSVIGAIICGSLIAFLYFNLFSKKQKIFMGDTGSLIIGFLISIMAIHFMEYNIPEKRAELNYTMTSAPAVAMGILIIPVVDTVRVFFLRLSKGRSPFAADKIHIHHRLLTLGFSHIQIASVIGACNSFFVIISFLLKDMGMIWLILLNFSLGILLFQIPALFIKRKKRKLLTRKKKRAQY
ncbi:MraY family glycosyltransferase [Marinilabiliaceae bacterium ANBcel2]|nr:MraY family glycosyltransferase [Marinilabiliaceae bacterium ANBcel2]